MTKQKTYFEQVPVAVAKQLVWKQSERPGAFLVSCRICGIPVGLEDCKVDERGGAVHEKCYVSGLARNRSSKHQSRSIGSN